MQDKKMYLPKKGAPGPLIHSVNKYQIFFVSTIIGSISVYEMIKDLLICFSAKIPQYSE